MKNKTNTTGMLTYKIEGINEKFKVVEISYEFGWMDCARVHRQVKASTQKYLKLLYDETLENRNKSFDSLYTILECLLSPRELKSYTDEDGNIIDYNRQVLKRIFGGKINGYKVLDHLMDRAYKYC